MTSVRHHRLWVVASILAALGVAIFGALAWRVVNVEQMDENDAAARFHEVLASFDVKAPLVTIDESGRLVRQSSGIVGPRPAQLHVLAYRVNEERLFQADVPLWFVKVKGPALQYALRGTGFDPEPLGLTASELEQAGARVVFDQTRANGDRVLAWTR